MATGAGSGPDPIRTGNGGTRTLLHVATDWPGYFPHGPAVVALLIGAGADPNAPVTGASHSETPLHWAASSDDVDVAAVSLITAPTWRPPAPLSPAAARWMTLSDMAVGMSPGCS